MSSTSDRQAHRVVLRAPMRSRLDGIDGPAAVAWALHTGLVGVGVGGTMADEAGVQARLRRFAEVPVGSFVWTRDGGNQLFVGVIDDALHEDPRGLPHDLLNVRAVHWFEDPMCEEGVPRAVLASFARGGRNLQRIRAPGALEETAELWARLHDAVTEA